MATSIIGYFGQETRNLRGRLSASGVVRAIAVHVGVVAVFGIFLPWWLGVQFLDPVTITAYACLGVMFASPAAAQAFAGERPKSMGEALARILVAVVYGELMAITILAAGFATFLSTHSTVFFPLDFASIGGAVGLGISGCLAMAAVAASISLWLSAGASRMALRIIFLALLFLFFFRSRWLPDVELSGIVVCLVVAAAGVVAVRQKIAVGG